MTDLRWFDLFREYYGVNLTRDRAATWMRLMNEPDALSDVTEDELCDVLRWVRKKREGDEYRKAPTLEELIGWVKWYRKSKAEARRGVTSGMDGNIGRIKEMMLKAPDGDTRWDIMCDEGTVPECDILYRWARGRWPDFGMPRNLEPVPRAGIMQNVSNELRSMADLKTAHQQHRFAPHELDTE